MGIGKRIRARRLALGLTQAALAARAGTHEVSVCLIEKERRDPTAETVAKLAAALNCAPADLSMPARRSA